MKIVTEFQNILICLSGAPIGSNHENNMVRISRDTLSLRRIEEWLWKSSLLYTKIYISNKNLQRRDF